MKIGIYRQCDGREFLVRERWSLYGDLKKLFVLLETDNAETILPWEDFSESVYYEGKKVKRFVYVRPAPAHECVRCGAPVKRGKGKSQSPGESDVLFCWDCLQLQVAQLKELIGDLCPDPGCEEQIYLGDSVYAGFDGYNVVLTTNNGLGANNVIYMEPAVLNALDLYRKRLTESHESNRPDQEAPSPVDAESSSGVAED
jgi:hypothetical protein